MVELVGGGSVINGATLSSLQGYILFDIHVLDGGVCTAVVQCVTAVTDCSVNKEEQLTYYTTYQLIDPAGNILQSYHDAVYLRYF